MVAAVFDVLPKTGDSGFYRLPKRISVRKQRRPFSSIMYIPAASFPDVPPPACSLVRVLAFIVLVLLVHLLYGNTDKQETVFRLPRYIASRPEFRTPSKGVAARAPDVRGGGSTGT